MPVGHPVRFRISFPPATARETAKALGIRPDEKKVAEDLVKWLLHLRKARSKKTNAVNASA